MKGNNRYWLALAAFLAIVIVIALLPAKKPKKEVKPTRVITRVIKGKIAIVLDDWGYNLNNIGMLEEIKQPLTLAILPNLKFSKKISQDLHQRGFEIILHLPTEPNEKFNLEKDTIRATMDKKQIGTILSNGLLNIVYAKGVSNHMGSKVTS
ncbi:MAG: divergent polysaccharide deacetylase family protein, partial [Candidatus Omnitrophota bacterium]